MTSRSEIERVIEAHAAADLSTDTVFEVLAEQRRRFLLESLAEHGYSLTLADLADEVASREYDAHITEISEDDVLEVYLSLYHQHVPKLAAADVVAYDQDRDLVARASNASVVEQVMALAVEG